MRTPAWWVGLWCVVLVACEPMGGADGGDDAGAVVVDAGRSTDAGAEDAGVVDAGVDAGTPDAGGFDAGPQDSVTLSASTTFDDRVQLTWDAGDVFALGWVIERDGQMVAQVGGGLRRYDDFNAPAGRFDAFDASASQTFGHAIELEWSAPDASAGPMTRYRVRMSQPPYLASPNAMGQRAPPVLSGWRVTRADGGWLLSPSESSLEDTAAPGATLSVQSLSATARPEDWVSAVMLNVDASVTTAPNPVDYVVTAWSDTDVERALAVTGHRRLSGAVYQWQRSDADSPDASWSDLPRVHGVKWFDAEAPFNEGRYYRVALRHDGVEHVSNEVRALLWRPRFLDSNQGVFCLLRDDGIVKCDEHEYGALHDVVDFAATPAPCGLHSDGGTSCWVNGAYQPVSLPPLQHLLAGNELCGWADAGVFCVSGLHDPGLKSLVTKPAAASNGTTLCGWPHDGGELSCNGTAIPGAVAALSENCAVLDGGWLQCPALGIAHQLPLDFGQWREGSVLHNVACLISTSGRVHCLPSPTVGGALDLADSPVWSADTFVRWHRGGGGACGMTTEGRVRCHSGAGSAATLPSTQPVAAVRAYSGGALFLTASGELDSQGGLFFPFTFAQRTAAPRPPLSWTTLLSGSNVCGLTSTGEPQCLGNPPPLPAGNTYAQIVEAGGGMCGRRVDGTLDCAPSTVHWPHSGSWTWLGSDDNGGQACAINTMGNAFCMPNEPPIAGPLVRATRGCGLGSDRQVRCSYALPPGVGDRRYKELRSISNITCAIALEGELVCWGASGAFNPSPWTDYVSISLTSNGICGVRADQTAACVGWFGESFAHSLP